MRTVFVKSSCQYAEEFCALTSIVENEQGERFVRKQPMSPRGEEHLRDMYLSSRELPEILDKVDICDCSMEGDSVLFPYHVGVSCYEHILRQSRLSPEKGLKAWEEMLALLEPKTEAEVPFHDSEAFRALFGDGAAFEGERAYPCIAFDLTPANILLRDGKAPVLIDYEWRIDAPVPVALVKYHAVATSYYMFAEMDSVGPPLEQVLALTGMKASKKAYQKALEHFYKVIGGRDVKDGLEYGKIRRKYEKTIPGTLAEEFQKREGEIAYLKAQNQAVEQQWKSDAAQWEEQTKGKDEYIAYLESQNHAIDDQWKTDAAQWQEQAKEKDGYIAYLESQNHAIDERWKADADQWQEQAKGKDEYITYLESQNRAIEEQWQKDNAQWQKDNAQWQQDNAQWQQDKAQWQQDNAQWQQDKAQWREQKDSLEGQIIYLESQSHVMERQWQKDVAQWQSDQAQWQAERDRLSGELTEQEAAYDRMVHSLSWRLTKPLRGVDWVLRRLFHKN